ncbi:hypothetical protein COU78_05845 [Candidatus Peregrinibacteria bacterium CG10_big_fil_rev_8_21_14_0_10_49_24]|nr:MAG: hypothetical protein COV83_04550 [Candidatus Peregrinibacteria bacterium CG11_big_fil_rev_8_21_14_0_20_49_14]PIR50543.1 MAG: hypothetical protein COU78_05845 [Candidatus Peregrinibacteria bacterium CG10_big_fil_rev_8_21_14_0_10_49_24]PJA67912.1 MAG: hypothetical protein CO157_02010 [Candidatus Peregrinibacteria bacterium CG_4_9_14_3_um_filter_49_12]
MDFLLHIIIMACLTLFPLLGYNIVFGKGKILHFGQEAQSLMAVYTLWVLVVQFQQPFLLALLASLLTTTMLSLLLAQLSFRLEPDGFGVMSIALHLAVLSIILNWQSVTRGALGIPRIPRGILPSSLERYALVVVLGAIAWYFFLRRLERSSFGRNLVALSEHEWHAESLGISRKKVHTIAFLLAGTGSMISAILFPPYIFLLSPLDYNFQHMIFFVMCAVAGGPGSLRGVTLAIFLIIFLREGLRFMGLPADILGPVQIMSFGLILFVAVCVRRDTLFPKQRTV